MALEEMAISTLSSPSAMPSRTVVCSIMRLGAELGQHLAHLDDNAGDFRLLLPRQHPSWCDTSHNPFES